MKYIDIYNEMVDPFDYEETLDVLAEAYTKRNGFGGFYSSLITTTKKDYPNKYDVKESDKFYATAFNKWKKGIVTLTKDEFEKLKARKSYDDRLIKLRNYLKTVPDVTTSKEARQILNQKFEDEDLASAIEDYRWDSVSFGTGWEHVKSRYLNGKRGTSFPIAHRLYLNTEGIDTHKVINEIIKKCDERKIPYYFKFDDQGARDDTIVVYSDTEKLPSYIEILREIAKENPEIKRRSKRPPILTGRIDNWIGYGAEPARKNGKNRSFNEVRSKCIEDAIEGELTEWLKINKNKIINYQGKSLSITECISSLALNKEINSMKQRLNNKPNYQSQAEHEKHLGYNEQYLNQAEFQNNLHQKIKVAIQKDLDGKINNSDLIEITLKDGLKRTIYSNQILHWKDLIVPFVMKNNLAFRAKVKERINQLSEQENIDTAKYCFDKDTKNKFTITEQNIKTVKDFYNVIKSHGEKKSIDLPRQKEPSETIYQYYQYLMNYCKNNNLLKANKTLSNKINNSKLKSQSTDNNPETKTTVQNNKPDSKKDQDIRKSQVKLGFISPGVFQNTTYNLKKNQIIQDLPIYSTVPSRFKGIMTDEEIKQAQKKIGQYKPLKSK